MKDSPAQRVADASRGAIARLPPGATRDALGGIQRALDGPLRIAVVGRLKAGKSTLVNALLGQRIAATDVAECTKVVTVFEYGFPELVEIHRRDGAVTRVPLELDSNGAARIPLDALAVDIDYVRVTLSNDTLGAFTLIDTPGLSSLTPGVSERTSELLAIDGASRRAMADAHAVVFLISPSPKRDEMEALAALRASLGSAGASAANTVAVLTKADQLAEAADTDPWQTAVRLTDGYASDPAVRNVAATVIPVIGLLAETAESGVLTEIDVRHLRALADVPAADRELMLMGADAFLASASRIPSDAASRLLDALDLYGLRRALQFLDLEDGDASALHRHLRRVSGIDRLRHAIEERFAERADLLKADAALASLERIVHQLPGDEATGGSRTLLRDMLESLDLDPGMHPIREHRALRAVAMDESVQLPPDLSEDLRRVLLGTDVRRQLGVDTDADHSVLEEAALAGARRWNAFGNDGRASPAEARVAEVVYRSYTLLWEAVTATRSAETGRQ